MSLDPALATALTNLGASALALAPSLFDAIAAGNDREARDIAQEMARREAFDVAMRKRAEAVKARRK